MPLPCNCGSYDIGLPSNGTYRLECMNCGQLGPAVEKAPRLYERALDAWNEMREADSVCFFFCQPGCHNECIEEGGYVV